MMKVADGLQSGAQILEHFGGNRKKKVYLYLPPASTANSSTASSSVSTATSSSMATLVTNAVSGQPIVTPVVSSLPIPTNGSSTTNPSSTSSSGSSTAYNYSCSASSSGSSTANSNSAYSSGSSTTNSTQASSSGSNATSSSVATLVTNAVSGQPIVTPVVSSLPIPTNGPETRRYLSLLAGNAFRDDVHHLQVDDSDEEELLQSPFEVDRDVIFVTSPQVPHVQTRQRRTRPPAVTSTTTRPTNSDTSVPLVQTRQRRTILPAVTSTTTRPTNSDTSGCYDKPFYGDGIRVGTVTEDLSSHGLGGVSSRLSKTDEVHRCEAMLQVMYNHLDASMPPLLSHTFEELCWHARECSQPIVAILLDPSRQNKASRVAMLRALQRVMAGCQDARHWLFWGAETTSEDGQKILELYGNGQGDQVFLLAPSTGQHPSFIERIEANNLDSTDFNPNKLHERVKIMIEGLILEREQLKKWQKERMEQEMLLREAKKLDKAKEKQKEKEKNQRQHERQKEKEVNQRQHEKQNEKEENQRQQEKQKKEVDQRQHEKQNEKEENQRQQEKQKKEVNQRQHKKQNEKEENQRQQEKQKEEVNQRQQEKQKEKGVVEVEDAAESLMAKQIREARRARVRPPPDEGTKIILRINSEHTRRIGRLFEKNALFQEVYDWAGSMDCVPLHFTIQRRQTVVRHSDPLEQHEILDLMEREGNQINSLLESQVSFSGNFPPIEVNEHALSDTVVDSPQREIREEVKATEEEKGEKVEGKATEKEENDQRQESKEEETRQDEMDVTEERQQGQEEEMDKEKEQMEGTSEGERIQKKRKKDKRTTAKRRKAKHVKI